MKRYLISIILLCGLAFAVSAQTFHAIIFANTKNNDIGTSVEVDFQRMSLEFTTMAKSIGYNLKKYYFYGAPSNFNRNNLVSCLRNLDCTPKDIVFFFYSGHGGRAINETSDFPEMILAVNHSTFNDLYSLSDVYKQISKKGPRLAIVMGDLCNSEIEGYYKDSSLGGSKSATIINKGTCDVYRNLFLNVKGGFIAASSEPNQSSSCYRFQGEDGKIYEGGGYLTFSFLGFLQDYVDKGEDVSWSQLLDDAIAWTKYKTQNRKSGAQVPIYKDELSVATPEPVQPVSTPPQEPIQSNDDATNYRDKVAYSLSMVCNENIDRLERIRNIESAKHYFAGSAIVQVVGCDGHTIVNTSNANRYLNYLSMATSMDQIVVLDMKQENGNIISYIKVHELHYQ